MAWYFQRALFLRAFINRALVIIFYPVQMFTSKALNYNEICGISHVIFLPCNSPKVWASLFHYSS